VSAVAAAAAAEAAVGGAADRQHIILQVSLFCAARGEGIFMYRIMKLYTHRRSFLFHLVLRTAEGRYFYSSFQKASSG